MDSAGGLAEKDVRQMVRLLADVAILEGGHPEKKRALMEGLQQLVDADGWLWSMTRVDLEKSTPVSFGVIHGGLSDEQMAGWIEASQTPSCPPPEDSPLAEELQRGKHFTRRRHQIVPDEVWYSHPAVKKHRLRVGLDHFLYSIYPLDGPETCSAIGFFRYHGRESFSDRDARVAHILLSEVKWLHYAELPPDQGAPVLELTHRQRTILLMLIEARNKDQIAELLRISPYTVKDHIKAIYSHYNVSSQLELIQHFRFGDGGDRATG